MAKNSRGSAPDPGPHSSGAGKDDGLRFARTLARYGINLQTARINTLGDRAEDVFLVSGEALSNSKTVLQLEQDLLKELSLAPRSAAVVEPAPL